MKPHFACVSFLLLAVAVTTPAVRAGDDVIEFYTDASMMSCELADQAPALVQVHVFHAGTLPTAVVSFGARPPACWVGATWLGDIVAPGFTPGGNSTQGADGLYIFYPECLMPPTYLGYMNFAVAGSGQSCCLYAASDPPLHPMFVADCTGFPERYPTARPIVINPDASCSCVSPVAVEETSWGKVKALYGD